MVSTPVDTLPAKLLPSTAVATLVGDVTPEKDVSTSERELNHYKFTLIVLLTRKHRFRRTAAIIIIHSRLFDRRRWWVIGSS